MLHRGGIAPNSHRKLHSEVSAMPRIPCFLYAEGTHFYLPPHLSGLPRVPSRFLIHDADGSFSPDPSVFSPTTRPDDAAVFLFPLDIGVYVDCDATADIGAVIESLPYFAGCERRHLISDAGDRPATIPQPACIFATSILRNNRTDVIPMPYVLSGHSPEHSFDWRSIRFDVSFVGNVTNPLRRVMVTSIRHEAPQLRLFADFDDSVVIDGAVCRHIPQTPEQKAHRQNLFLHSLRTSYCILCPPGVGPQSARLYETMRAGRIPIIIENDSIRPLEEFVDYDSFCCIIPKNQVLHTGSILFNWFSYQDNKELQRRCVQSFRIWNTWFSPDRINAALLKIAAQRFCW